MLTCACFSSYSSRELLVPGDAKKGILSTLHFWEFKKKRKKNKKKQLNLLFSWDIDDGATVANKPAVMGICEQESEVSYLHKLSDTSGAP